MTSIDWSRRPVAIVTGAASGIGAASASALAERGARVAVLDVDAERGRAVASAVRGLFVQLDVRSPEDWSRGLEAIHAELGPVELAHLNAGVMTLAPQAELAAAVDLAAISDAVYRRILGINVDGVFFGLRALAAGMQARRRGRIVVTASIGGLTAVPFDPLYAMTKHAIIGLVRSAAPMLAAHGIALSAICPGGVDTPLVPDSIRALSPPLLAAHQVARAVVEILDSPRGGIFIVRPERPDPEPFLAPAIELA